MEYLIQQYPNAKKIIVIQDNLNTHKKGSFYEHRQASIAAEMADKLEFHYTPKCSSWLNMIEIEFSAIARTALNKRIPTIELLTEQINAIVKERNDKEIKIKWQFSIETARKTLESKYHKVNKKNKIIKLLVQLYNRFLLSGLLLFCVEHKSKNLIVALINALHGSILLKNA